MFVTIQVIAPNEELRVWYAAYYAEQLGKKTLRQMDEEQKEVLPENKGKGLVFGLVMYPMYTSPLHHFTTFGEQT